MNDSTRNAFDALARVLMRCWVFGFVLLLLWVGGFVSHAVHTLNGAMFDLSDHELNLIHYCGIASLKLAVLILFFIPWLSIRLVLKQARTA